MSKTVGMILDLLNMIILFFFTIQFDEKAVWYDQSSVIEAQQSDQPELQITLQEVIGMIDSTVHEETIGDDVRHEETIGDDIRHEETIGEDVRREEMMIDEVQQWFDWVV